jgi:hypothetical protein
LGLDATGLQRACHEEALLGVGGAVLLVIFGGELGEILGFWSNMIW